MAVAKAPYLEELDFYSKGDTWGGDRLSTSNRSYWFDDRESTEQAQDASASFTSYSLFYNGEFITKEILSVKKFEKILAERGL